MSNDALTLELRGITVSAFKNNKMLARGRIITNPKRQKQMDAITRDFVSALRSAIRMRDEGTLTEAQAHCLTALCEHSTNFDDSRQWIPELHIVSHTVPKGEEGCQITINRLS